MRDCTAPTRPPFRTTTPRPATLVANSGEWISIADVRDTVVGPKGMVGFYTQPPTADTVMLGLLHPSSSK